MGKMFVYGIGGDYHCSEIEFQHNLTKDFDIFSPYNKFTDDSIMTMAVATALRNSYGKDDETIRQELRNQMYRFYQKYNNKNGHRWVKGSYGPAFERALHNDKENFRPNGSWGDGAPMRVSAAGWMASSLSETRHLAKLTAEVSHNAAESIEAAEATAAAIFLFRAGKDMKYVMEYMKQEFLYDVDTPLDQRCPNTHHGGNNYESCHGTMPVVLRIIQEATDYEDAIRLTGSVDGDSDTLAEIVGSIWEAMAVTDPTKRMTVEHEQKLMDKFIAQEEEQAKVDNKETLFLDEWNAFEKFYEEIRNEVKPRTDDLPDFEKLTQMDELESEHSIHRNKNCEYNLTKYLNKELTSLENDAGKKLEAVSDVNAAAKEISELCAEYINQAGTSNAPLEHFGVEPKRQRLVAFLMYQKLETGVQNGDSSMKPLYDAVHSQLQNVTAEAWAKANDEFKTNMELFSTIAKAPSAVIWSELYFADQAHSQLTQADSLKAAAMEATPKERINPPKAEAMTNEQKAAAEESAKQRAEELIAAFEENQEKYRNIADGKGTYGDSYPYSSRIAVKESRKIAREAKKQFTEIGMAYQDRCERIMEPGFVETQEEYENALVFNSLKKIAAQKGGVYKSLAEVLDEGAMKRFYQNRPELQEERKKALDAEREGGNPGFVWSMYQRIAARFQKTAEAVVNPAESKRMQTEWIEEKSIQQAKISYQGETIKSFIDQMAQDIKKVDSVTGLFDSSEFDELKVQIETTRRMVSHPQFAELVTNPGAMADANKQFEELQKAADAYLIHAGKKGALDRENRVALALAIREMPRLGLGNEAGIKAYAAKYHNRVTANPKNIAAAFDKAFKAGNFAASDEHPSRSFENRSASTEQQKGMGRNL